MEEIREGIIYPALVIETEHLNLEGICNEDELLKRFKICRNEEYIEDARKEFKAPKITRNFHFMQVAKRTENYFNK